MNAFRLYLKRCVFAAATMSVFALGGDPSACGTWADGRPMSIEACNDLFDWDQPNLNCEAWGDCATIGIGQ